MQRMRRKAPLQEGAKLRRCLAEAQRLCGGGASPPPASYRHRKQTRRRANVCHRGLASQGLSEATDAGEARCTLQEEGRGEGGKHTHTRAFTRTGRGAAVEKAENVHKSVFPVGGMRTDVKLGDEECGCDFRCWEREKRE